MQEGCTITLQTWWQSNSWREWYYGNYFFFIHFPKNLNYLIQQAIYFVYKTYHLLRCQINIITSRNKDFSDFPAKFTCIFYWAYVFKCYLKFISRKMIIIISRSMKGWGCLYENLYRYMHWYSALVYLKSLFSFSKKIFIIFQCSCTVSYKQNFPPFYRMGWPSF